MQRKFLINGLIAEVNAENMTLVEYQAIKRNRDTPNLVILEDGTQKFNDYTCYGGYDGTCNCISHKKKSWITVKWVEVM